jgi:hypothetical protein
MVVIGVGARSMNLSANAGRSIHVALDAADFIDVLSDLTDGPQPGDDEAAVVARSSAKPS